jgi:hypothetical protein
VQAREALNNDEIAVDEADRYVDRLVQLMSGLRNVMLVRSAGPFRGQLLGVEHGESPPS